jgi:hypothetical protein
LALAWDLEGIAASSRATTLAEETTAFQRLCSGSGGEGYVFGSLDTPGLVEAAADPKGPFRWVLLPHTPEGKITDYFNGYRRAVLSLKGSRRDFLAMGPRFSARNSGDSGRFLGYNGDITDMVMVDDEADLSKSTGSSEVARAVHFAEMEVAQITKAAQACLNRAVPLGEVLRLSIKGGDPDGYGSALAVLSFTAGWALLPEGPLFFDREGQFPTEGSPLGRAVELMGDFASGEPLNVTDFPPEFRVAARRRSDGEVRILMVNVSPNHSQGVNLALGSGHGNLVVDARLDRTASFALPAGSAAVISVHPGPGRFVQGRWWGYHQAIKGDGVQDLEIH